MPKISLVNTDPNLPQMTHVHGGPKDGLEVMCPPPQHRALRVCIGIACEASDQFKCAWGELVYAVYMWMPLRQRFEWRDYITCTDQIDLQKKLCEITDNETKKRGVGR